MAIQRFVEACARPDHPLVLVLDDMHPSDRASRDLLVELLATSRSASLLVVVALRDSEGTGEKDVDEFLARLRESEVPVTELTLPPLDLACVSQLLADVLARDPQGCRDLAETFLLKTGGNPLLIREFLLRMHEEGGIRFEPGKGWQWDLEAIVAADLLEGAVGLMIDKLERLASGEIEMLKLSSCVGDAFDVTLLCDVTHLEREVVEPALFGLADAGLLLPSRLGFRFAHGRIREAARALLSDEDRARLHCDIGRRLLERTSPEDLGQRCLMIADHLNRGRSYIEEPFRRSALVVGLQAGEAALAAGAATAADTYLAAARELLRDEDWEGGEVRVLALFLQSAEALHQIGETDRALGLLDRLEARRLERIELGFVLAKRVRVLTGQRPADAVEAARASLHRLGVRWPREPSWLRLWLETFHTDWALRGPLGVSRFAIVDRRNLDWAPPLAVIAESGPAMIQRAPRLLALATMYSLRVLARHGTPRPIAVAFAAYAAIHADFRGHAQGIERYVAAAEEWIEQTSDPLNVRAEWSLLYFSRAWLQERRPSIEPLARVSERLREVGALDYATHASQARFACLALTGEPLDRVADEVAEMRRHEHWPGMRSFLELFPYTYGLLRLDTVRPIDWDRASESAEPSLRKLSLLGRIHWVFTLCVLGEYRRVEAEVRRTGLEELPRTPLVAPDFMLCRGVAAAGLAHTLRGRARRRCVRTVRESLRWLRHRMARQPDCAHMIRILEAELAFARGREGEAFRLYPAAATGAQTRGYVHHAALAHDRHATLLRQARREHEARSVLLQAIEAYREWGALARIRQLEGRRELRHRTDR